jgi:putative membrane protein
MHIGHSYSLREFLYWTRREIYRIGGWATAIAVLYYAGLTWIAIPWVPVALVGTAAAFIVGFRNTQTYNRLWEARMIWGSIVNNSRTWGILARDLTQGTPEDLRWLINRHVAWLTALRYQLRRPQPWENSQKASNREYQRFVDVPEWDGTLEERLKALLPAEEWNTIASAHNQATQVLALQSAHLKHMAETNRIAPLHLVELEQQLGKLYDDQGKCERIKNFPYPRQFASINLYFIRLFAFLLPMGMLQEFAKLGQHTVWLTIPFSVVVGWVFISMERVGEATENPFEGGANDIPMATMATAIEIDLREMAGHTNLPPPIASRNNIVM